jgi:hypothetical protein
MDGALADGGAGAVILVHHHRNMGEFLNGGQNQMPKERRTGVFPGTSRGLHDYRRVGLVRRFHDGAHLFKVIDVKRRHTVPKLGCVIEQLTHRD